MKPDADPRESRGRATATGHGGRLPDTAFTLVRGAPDRPPGDDRHRPMLTRDHFRERSSLLAVIARGLDATAILLAGWIAHDIRMGRWVLPEHYQIALLLGALFTLVCFSALGTYQWSRGSSIPRQLRQVIVAWLLVAAVLMAVAVATKTNIHFSRQWMAWWLVLGAGTLVAGRIGLTLVLRTMRERGWNRSRIVLIGAGTQAAEVIERLRRAPWIGLEIEAVFSLEPRDSGSSAGAEIRPLDELGTFVERQRIDEVWLTLPAGAEVHIPEILQQLAHSTAGIRYVPGIQDLLLMNPAISEVAGMAVLDLNVTSMQGINRILKCIEDRVLAAVILVLISPLLLAIAICVKLDSRGPALFKQRRNGVDGRPIKVYKFRTMDVDQPEFDKVHQACRDDPRVTRVGRFLRRTSLDELPQFFNVIQGRMSIVGPRPHALVHNEYYKHRVEAYMRRHCVKPGITGWAQVNGYRGETDTLEKMQKRVEHDLWYIDNWSLWLDLRIIALTLVRIWKDRNAY